MSYLTIEDINPDKRLSVAIAVTFEVSVYHLHESSDIKGCLLKALRWENYGSIEFRYEHPDRCKYIGAEMRALLPLILDYKINVSKQAFKDSERVFELLDEDLKEKFLFNLDILQ